jgi:hypothetical protein
MDVKIKAKCGRCNKAEEKTVSLETASSMDEAREDADRKFGEFTDVVKDAVQSLEWDKNGPELIVMGRTDTGYEVRQLSDMCNAPDAKRNKGCVSRVKYLIKELFMENPKKPSTPKKPKDKPADPTPPKKPANGKKK